MNLVSKDLLSIQEARTLVANAKKAQDAFSKFTQEQVDHLVETLAKTVAQQAEPLAQLAVAETGFGNVADKTLKNIFASTYLAEKMRDMKTIGVLKKNPADKTMDIAVPVGVVLGLIPSTNPTSTVIYKVLISLKAGNAIVLSPHPSALDCIVKTTQILIDAAEKAGAPPGLISCLTVMSKEGANTLLTHPDIALILATGGTPMVRAAYSSGNPAIGVGPGNSPVYIESSADIEKAVKDIVTSKTFDNGVICASEQAVIVEKHSDAAVRDAFKKNGGYFLTPEESQTLSKFLLRDNGSINPAIVGKDAQTLANMVGITIPPDAKVLLSEQTDISHKNPYAREKLAPILAYFIASSQEDALKKSCELLKVEGEGHTFSLHTKDDSLVEKASLIVPASRILVNSPGSLGGVGGTTNLFCSFTLGCGAMGGSSTSDNVGPEHLYNIRKVAYGVRSLSDLKAS
ncbi:acetaldehyde dehydrogenase (acetylating) [Entomobacter blattae]|uniref:Aldehyde-alcohol dehydrogenase n=1 Tax=Entomobacter blattae TaxID=2762277 RepID=A0A7H1NNU3_9PROT|nr:acetaldehyde dehydrogenase (acetylating) [Entomobacter blattae]QNT77453.1 Aldehyde-alcohol dehydrogenase [Entomobacter blattae]